MLLIQSVSCGRNVAFDNLCVMENEVQAAMTNPLLRGLVDLLRPSVQRACVLTASRRTVIMPADLPTLQRSLMPRQRLSSTEVMEYLADARADHSALMPANLSTLAHFSVSSAMCFPKSAGEPASTVAPRLAKRALMLGSARAALISLL